MCDIQDGNSVAEAVTREVGGTAVGLAGGSFVGGLATGAVLGTEIGSVVPGAGTAVGLVVGAGRCILCITTSALTVRLAGRGRVLTEVQRELIQSIGPRIVPLATGGELMQVEIAYKAVDSSETKTVLLGLQLTVQPINLLNALAYWQDAAVDDPNQLLDRIELILRGRAAAGV